MKGNIFFSQRVVPVFLGAMLIFLGRGQVAQAAQFDYLQAGFTQEIFTGPIAADWGPGMSWSSGGNMLARSGSTMYEYSLTADTVYHGTNVHGYTAHTVAGLGFGYGTTNGLDGYIYANSADGLTRVDTSTWTASVMAGSSSGYYGIGTLPDGRIVYSDGTWSGNVYAYDLTTNTETLIYSAGSFIDDLAIAPTGEIFLAVLGSDRIDVIDGGGAVLNTFGTAHSPDGIAFGAGTAYSNNTDGTITQYNFANPDFTGAVTENVIASGGSYGDLASVGPDGMFYVSQWGGMTWDDGTTTFDNAIVRIGPEGAFTASPGTVEAVPAPDTFLVMGSGFLAFIFLRRRPSQLSQLMAS